VYLVQELITRKIIRKFYGLQFSAINKHLYKFPDGVKVNVDYATISDMEAHTQTKGMLDNYIAYLNKKTGIPA
jgi:hypothetical protein